MGDLSQWPHAVLAARYWGWLLQGWLMTIWATLIVVAFSTLLGIFLAVARSSTQAWLRWLARLYLSAFRNTPLLVQLFFWYFGLPALLPQAVVQWLNTEHVLGLGVVALPWPSFEFVAAIIGMIFYSTAYVGEEIRAGFNGVPATQVSAGLALGMRRLQVLRHVVLPQALAIIKPALFVRPPLPERSGVPPPVPSGFGHLPAIEPEPTRSTSDARLQPRLPCRCVGQHHQDWSGPPRSP